jgi:shikimate dehydrogenase
MQHKYGLIGQSLVHSFSRSYFNQKFNKLGLTNYQYDNYEFDDIQEIEKFLRSTDCRGLNVTIPYKEAIITYVDELDEDASAIGAVNTLKKYPNGEIKGFNTDVIGFTESLNTSLTNDKKALILGSGGASKAIIYALKQMRVECITVSRSPSQPHQINYQELRLLDLQKIELIVNCSPIGSFPKTEEQVDFPYEKLNDGHFVYDLIYNPAKTHLLKKAEQKGCRTQNGQRMLELQAEASWKIWQDQTI